MNTCMDHAVGCRQDRSRRARRPSRGWRFLTERNPGERALGDRYERRFRVSTTAAGNLDWHSARTSTSPGAIPATYTGPATLSATPDAVMTAPPYEWPTSRTGPGPARSRISCTRPQEQAEPVRYDPAARQDTSVRRHRSTNRSTAFRRKPLNRRWGGWGSNPRPTDYEKHCSVHRAR